MHRQKACVPVEKPVADTVRRASASRRGASRGARVLVGHHRTHNPILGRRSADRRGAPGTHRAVMGARLFQAGPLLETAVAARGGGPHPHQHDPRGEHAAHVVRGIVAVQAVASNAVRGHAVEDTVSINLRFASGRSDAYVSDTARARAAGSRRAARTRGTPSTATRTPATVIAHAALWRAGRCASSPTPMPTGLRGGSRSSARSAESQHEDPLAGSWSTSRGDPRRGGAAGERARRPRQPALSEAIAEAARRAGGETR